jgi:hypothetical protein
MYCQPGTVSIKVLQSGVATSRITRTVLRNLLAAVAQQEDCELKKSCMAARSKLKPPERLLTRWQCNSHEDGLHLCFQLGSFRIAP